METLEGRVAVVTGGASGIGRGTALALAGQGVRLVLGDLNEAGLKETADLVAARGGLAVTRIGDVASDETAPALLAAALEAFGRADIVMNNVGVIAVGAPENIPTEAWADILDINFLSMVRSNHVFLPHFIAQGQGHIVNTASFAALFPYASNRIPYMASKAAVIALSEGLALYAKPKGVGVTLLLPGPVRTAITRSVRRYGDAPLSFRGPGATFSPKEPEEVGEMVVAAIRENRFFLPTDPQIYAILEARAKDPEGFMAAQIAAVSADQPK